MVLLARSTKSLVLLSLDICWGACQKNRSSKLLEASMKEMTDLLAVFGGMSGGVLAVSVILAAFGLAAFAIYAVLTLAKERH